MTQILDAAYKAWADAGALRERRLRHKNFAYGNQWCDMVRNREGIRMTEKELLEQEGAKPLTNNLIRQLIKTVVGRWRWQTGEKGSYTDGAIAGIASANSLAELDSRALEEFLISGCVIQRIARERRWGGYGIWIYNVDPRKFFVNDFRDPRGWDIDLIGMLHDMTLPEIVNRFAGESHAKAAEISLRYATADATGPLRTSLIGSPDSGVDFFSCDSAGRCRVIEVWTLDCREKTDSDSPVKDFVWHCRYLAPDGYVLSEHDSPFSHGSHPFALKFYPLTDGEVHSFVEDVIDQQRHINRIIVAIDKMMSSAAKGVLIFPMDQRVDGTRWEDITGAWAHSDGVIAISGKGQHLPQQVMTNTANTGAYQMLDILMKLFDDISGVGSALLGRSQSGSTGAEMLESQIRNATIALADIFETFASFTESRNTKARASR